MSLDVVTTALCRPEVLEMTYQSFFDGWAIKDLPNLRIILNIDPLGEGDPSECVAIARRYSDQVVYRIASRSNFAEAVNWCRGLIESPYYLWLEDDWFLAKRFCYESLLAELQAAEKSQIVLPMGKPRLYPSSYSFRPHVGVSCQIKSVPTVPIDQNPEKWTAQELGPGVSIDYPLNRTVVDLGRKWAKARGFRKIDKDSWYEPRNNQIVGQMEYGFLKARVRAALLLRKCLSV